MNSRLVKMRPTFQNNFATPPSLITTHFYVGVCLFCNSVIVNFCLLCFWMTRCACVSFLLAHQFAESNCPAILNPTPSRIPLCIVPVCHVWAVTWELIFLCSSPFKKHLYPSRCLVHRWTVLTELAKHIQSIFSQSTHGLLPKEKKAYKIK